jgi:hypothetical protein
LLLKQTSEDPINLVLKDFCPLGFFEAYEIDFLFDSTTWRMAGIGE